MNVPHPNLGTVHALMAAGHLTEARALTQRLLGMAPKLGALYRAKLAEIDRLLDGNQATAGPALGSTVATSQPLSGLLVLTATHSGGHHKAQAVRRTWRRELLRRGARHLFLEGSPCVKQPVVLDDTLYLPCAENYEGLLLKLALAYDHVLHALPNVSHVLKLDDDCHLDVHALEARLAALGLGLEGHDYLAVEVQPNDVPNDPTWHFGKCSDVRFEQPYPHERPPAPYALGGFGYLLSRRAMQVIAAEVPTFQEELQRFVYSYEDLRIGALLARAGIAVQAIPGIVARHAAQGQGSEATVIYDIDDPGLFDTREQELQARRFVAGGCPLPAEVLDQGPPLGRLGFDHVYLVSLRSEQGRRAGALFNLLRQGIEAELVSAFDGHSVLGLTIHERLQGSELGRLRRFPAYNELERLRGRRFIDAPGAVGYILTYVSILRDAQRRRLRKVLILEDDVLLTRDLRPRLAALLAKIGPDYKVLQLGASQYGWDQVDLDQAAANGYYNATPVDTCGSFAMALDHSVFEPLCESLLWFEAPFDHLPLGAIYESHPGQCIVAYPNLAMPVVTDSSIRGPREQASHAQLMRWRLEDFDFPPRRPAVAIVLAPGVAVPSGPAHDFEVDLLFFRCGADGLRPAHAAPPGYSEPTPPVTATCKVVRHALADIAFELKRDACAGEVAGELLEQLACPAIGGRLTRPWLKPLPLVRSRLRSGRASVIVPTKGRREPLELALRSILEQDHPDVELLVVNENAPDADISLWIRQLIDNLCHEHAARRLVLLQHEQPRSAAAARNTGLLAATGEFVSFLDDDDAFMPGRLSRVIARLEALGESVGAAYCGYLGWISKENDLGRYPTDDMRWRLLALDFQSHYVCTDTVTYRTASLLAINGYDEGFVRHQDLELNLRFLERFAIGAHPEALVQLNPLPADNANKLYDEDFFRLKQRFLARFAADVQALGPRAHEVIARHARELRDFCRQPGLLERLAVEHPSPLSCELLRPLLLPRSGG